MKYKEIQDLINAAQEKLEACIKELNKIKFNEITDGNKLYYLARSEPTPTKMLSVSNLLHDVAKQIRDNYEVWYICNEDGDWDCKDGDMPQTKTYLSDIVDSLESLSSKASARATESASPEIKNRMQESAKKYADLKRIAQNNVDHYQEIIRDLEFNKLYNCDDLIISPEKIIEIANATGFDACKYFLYNTKSNTQPWVELHKYIDVSYSGEDMQNYEFDDEVLAEINAIRKNLEKISCTDVCVDVYGEADNIHEDPLVECVNGEVIITIVITPFKKD